MKLGEKDKDFIRLSKALGATNKKIAEKIGCTEQAVWHYLKKNPLTVEEHKEAVKKEENTTFEIDQTELEMHLENAEEVFQPDNTEEVYREAIKQQEIEIERLHNRIIELKSQCNEQDKLIKVFGAVNNLTYELLKIFRGDE